MPRTSLLLVILSAICWSASASNWAQVAGNNRQNAGASSPTPWSRRWGFALTVIDFPVVETPEPDAPLLPMEQRSRLFVMGGDDFTGDISPAADLSGSLLRKTVLDDSGNAKDPNFQRSSTRVQPDPGAGGYQNDVWFTTGANWKVYADYRFVNGHGEPAPRLASNTNWTHVPNWPGIDEAVDGWRMYMACCHASNTFPCIDLLLCEDGDPYRLSRRWAPRRNHVALTVYDPAGTPTLVVMGGRARSYMRMLGSELNGGYIGNQFAADAVERHRSELTSDVWTSKDGAVWDYTNGGCYVPQLEHAEAPGSIKQRCTTDYDCFKAALGDATCVDAFTRLQPTRRMCVCRHWSPRERFAAAAHEGNIYVSGGVMYHQQFLCGAYACGSELPQFLDDLWASRDLGKTWIMVTPVATGAPHGRADHAFVRLGTRWWIIGGRGMADDPSKNSVDLLYNDAYASSDLETWALNVSTSDWSPRCGFSVVVNGSVLYLVGGEQQFFIQDAASIVLSALDKVKAAAASAPTNIDRGIAAAAAIVYPGHMANKVQLTTLPDVLVYYENDGAMLESRYEGWGSQVWFPDFGDRQGVQHTYVAASMNIKHRLLNWSTTAVEALTAIGIATIKDVALLPAETITAFLVPAAKNRDPKLPPPLPDVCNFYLTSVFLVERCAVKYVGFDDEAYRNSPTAIFPINVLPPPVAATGCEGVSAELGSVVPWAYDSVCQQQPPARRSMGSGLMGGRLYGVGGWEGENYFANDAWYRDDEPPVSKFLTVPSDGTSQSVFSFAASEGAVVCEMRAFDAGSGSLLRNWARIVTPYDGISLNAERKHTRVEVRCIDPAGNRDDSFVLGRNVFIWAYVPPFPLLAVILGVLFALFVLAGMFYAYRRYLQRKALERYMAKRLARRLKQQQAEDAELEANKGKGKKKKKKKKKKGEGGQKSSGTSEDMDMINRFRLLLRGRAERRVALEYSAMRGKSDKRVPAADQFKATAAREARDRAEAQVALQEEVEKERRAGLHQQAKATIARGAAMATTMQQVVEEDEPVERRGGRREPLGPAPARRSSYDAAAGAQSDASLPGAVRTGVADAPLGMLPPPRKVSTTGLTALGGEAPWAGARGPGAGGGQRVNFPPAGPALGAGRRAARAGGAVAESEDDVGGRAGGNPALPGQM
jgi:hypothetical protein